MRFFESEKALVCRARRFAFLLAAATLLLPGAALARDATVDCDGGPAEFATLTDAVNALRGSRPGPNSITVTGTCVGETVFIDVDSARLTIEAPVGQTATIQGSAIDIFGTGGGTTLRRLVITGSLSAGVSIRRASVATIQGCTIENSAGSGLQVDGNSTVEVSGGTPDEAVLIRNNGGQGIFADGSVLQINQFTIIENNAGVGLFLLGGRVRLFGLGDPVIVRGNGSGVGLDFGASGFFVGDIRIENNGGFGVFVGEGGSAGFIANSSDGTTIEGHSVVGLNLRRTAAARLLGPHQVRNNGTAGEPLTAGVRVVKGSSFLAVPRVAGGGGVEISNNVGPGVRAEDNATVVLIGSTISNNLEEGVRLVHLSVGEFAAPNTIFGNGVADLLCDATSLVVGDLTGISNVKCAKVEKVKKK